jgi:hypothetical protein
MSLSRNIRAGRVDVSLLSCSKGRRSKGSEFMALLFVNNVEI